MLSSRGEFVLKRTRWRVAALVPAGDGERLDPGRIRLIKEWGAIIPTAAADWLAPAREALTFMSSSKQ